MKTGHSNTAREAVTQVPKNEQKSTVQKTSKNSSRGTQNPNKTGQFGIRKGLKQHLKKGLKIPRKGSRPTLHDTQMA